MLKDTVFSSASKSSLEIHLPFKKQGVLAWAVQAKIPLVAPLFILHSGAKLGPFLTSKSILTSMTTDAIHGEVPTIQIVLPQHYQSFI